MEIIYPYLPAGREILYAPEDNPFIIAAKNVRYTESTDLRNPTGAVIVKNEIIIARAANKSKLANPALVKLHSKYCIRRILNVPSGKGYFLCPGCATHKEHAESRVVMEAMRQDLDTAGADLYLFGHWWCCEPCWGAMIKAGITNVYLVDKAWEMFKR